MRLAISAYKKVEYGLSLGVVSILILMIIIAPIDIYSFLQDPMVYIRVHHLDTSKENWKWDYIKRSLSVAVVSLAGLTFILLGLRKPKNTFYSTTKTIVVWLVIIFFVVGFYQFVQTGADQ